MKTIRIYQNINEALLDQSWLESNGIESFIPDEVSASSALPHLSVYSGIRLQVSESDYEAALKLLPDDKAPAQPEVKTEKKSEGTARTISLGSFKTLVLADLVIYLLLIALGYVQMSRTPESILSYGGDQYYSYSFALLFYYTYWPLTVVTMIASVGLFFLKSGCRALYVGAWVLGMVSSLFGTGYFVYPGAAFLGGLSALMGGFICCAIYFTNASDYFSSKRANS